MVFQDKNKYDTKKYRLCVRRTNRRILCSVIYATIAGDKTMAHADSAELAKFGLTAGQTNYAAAYATGLLLARRLLNDKKLDKKYEGKVKVDGKLYCVADDWKEEKKSHPFKANLDVGLVRTTTGNKVWGVLKGATDGGLEIPHSETRFIGYDKGAKEYDAEMHHKYIFGGHVSDYMKELEEDDQEAYNKQFAGYIEAGVDADSMEEMYQTCHANIRKDPSQAAKKDRGYKGKAPLFRRTRMSLEQKMDRAAQRITAKKKADAEAADEESDDEEGSDDE